MALGWLWRRTGFPDDAVDAAAFCVAGVALTALGWLWWRTGFPDDAVDAAVSWVAGAALGDIHLHFAWQAWHLVTSTITLRGRRGSDGTGLALVARLVPRLRLTHTTCSHTTCSHTTCPHTTCPHTTCPHTTCPHMQLAHRQLAHTQLVHTQFVHAHNLLTHNLLTHGLLVAHTNPSPSLFSFSAFPMPSLPVYCCLLEEVDMWGYPVL